MGTQEYHKKHISSHDTAYLAFRTKTKFKMLTGEKRQSCNNLTLFERFVLMNQSIGQAYRIICFAVASLRMFLGINRQKYFPFLKYNSMRKKKFSTCTSKYPKD